MSNTVDKVLMIAEGEVGYLEKASNSQLDSKTANAGSGNYTKYWRDIASSLQGNYWCQCFVDWIFNKAYGSSAGKSLLCCTSWGFYTPTCAEYFKSKNQWHTTPEKGDIIYFKNSQRICHVGIVYNVQGDTVYTVEGNTSAGASVVPNGGAVCKKSYKIGASNIAGYGRPNYDIEYKVGETYKFLKDTYLRSSIGTGSNANKIKLNSDKDKFVNDEKGFTMIKAGFSITVTEKKKDGKDIWVKSKAGHWYPAILNGEVRMK